jgi:hypothetical protein
MVSHATTCLLLLGLQWARQQASLHLQQNLRKRLSSNGVVVDRKNMKRAQLLGGSQEETSQKSIPATTVELKALPRTSSRVWEPTALRSVMTEG